MLIAAQEREQFLEEVTNGFHKFVQYLLTVTAQHV
ncbi:hypothetical protein PSYMO_12552 [Pseudomonas amygdali pv. mori str. 301020]|uniref:Uncharacterized protein n=1 Tax=Pseudomonas amygdali pv. mori str. 301020 TaxID=629261 RepID=A0A656G9L9_PSEA0|nr:hypothetical protein PSYMO_12552 [Pseudomonas amygdali pv. mori str. 301020]